MSDPVGVGRSAEIHTPAETGIAVDPRWAGIIEVLVKGLDGAVRWESDSVVLQLPGDPVTGRGADLDALRLCLVRIGVPVVFDASRAAHRDASLVEFLKVLVESGLLVTSGIWPRSRIRLFVRT